MAHQSTETGLMSSLAMCSVTLFARAPHHSCRNVVPPWPLRRVTEPTEARKKLLTRLDLNVPPRFAHDRECSVGSARAGTDSKEFSGPLARSMANLA
jgi:hypothetical protein